MDVILHVGAHRTATASLAVFFEQNKDEAREQRVAFWGGDRTRSGLFSGLMAHKNSIMPDTPRRRDRATQLIRMELDRLEKSGVHQLIVSEPSMIGTMMQNLQSERLYPNFQPRLSRFFDAFGDHCCQIAFSLRSYEGYWTSALAHAIPRGLAIPSENTVDRLVTQPRRWKTLISEARAVFPSAEVLVWPFEAMAGHPVRQIALMTGATFQPSRANAPWVNAAPNRRAISRALIERNTPVISGTNWPPFQNHHRQVLRAQYHEDLEWLKTNNDTLISYSETAGKHQRFDNLTDSQDVADNKPAYLRGHPNDREERRMV
ncbi:MULTISPECIES: hypothetical protein [Falsihalocynthiibacter]|uniref:hypothetical protein n=1 Tax=Falsihalocynthiibacter TaxID=2854182 RepID=UPI00300200A2